MGIERGRAMVAGLLAAAFALALAELLGGLIGPAPSLVQAVGDAVVDAAPPFAKDFAVAAFGTADKPALLIGIAVVALLVGAGVGLAARHRPLFGAAGIAAFAVLGGLAGAADPLASVGWAWAAAGLGAVGGIAVLRALLARAERASRPGGAQSARRDFLRAAGATGVLTLVGGGVGRMLSSGAAAVETERAAVRLAAPASPLPSPPAGLRVPGLTPLFVPNGRFYRIDTALSVPRVDVNQWRLEIGGPLAARTLTFGYDELVRRATDEQDVTIACVSNEVGGDLVGNARWLGLPLRPLLVEALGGRPMPPGAQVVGRSVDGFTAAFPFAALDDRVALVAVGMNGEPLPVAHGFPARLIVAGLYGYVSATKWLASIELHDADFQGYWIPRGWAKEAPVKTASRIDVPKHGARVAAGRVAVAGVAWAPDRGIERVEVRVGDGPWQQARLSESIGANAWRQWLLDWDATPGRHRLQVRATDGEGRVQTERRVAPRPDGATGWHTIQVRVD
jgi:DMSO/TMAO reductase YedYZ molybdopterin-dependent catalytic subunit